MIDEAQSMGVAIDDSELTRILASPVIAPCTETWPSEARGTGSGRQRLPITSGIQRDRRCSDRTRGMLANPTIPSRAHWASIAITGDDGVRSRSGIIRDPRR